MDEQEFWMFLNQFVAYFKIPNVCHNEPPPKPKHDMNQTTCPYEGEMIQTDGQAAVYLVVFCEKRWIPNPPTLDGLFNSWKITHFRTNPNILTGPAITNGALLIKASNNDAVYLHSNGHKYWIANPPTFDKFNFDWSKIHVYPPADVDRIPTGPIINSV